MAIIDNTLASQVPTFNPATPLAEAAQLQSAEQANQQAAYKQRQFEIGSEARGLQPFVNTPEFPAKWAETADRMLQKGLLTPEAHEQWRNKPSPLMLKSMIAATDDPSLSFRKDEAVREQGNADRSFGLQKTNADRNYGLAAAASRRADDPTPDGYEANPEFGKTEGATQYRPLSGGPQDPATIKAAAAARADIPRVIAPGEAVVGDLTGGKETYKNEGAGGSGTISDETADFAAGRILAGEKGVKTGYGRSPASLAKIDEAVTRKAREMNLSPSDLTQRGIDLVGDTSRERTAATQEGRMTSAGIEAKGAIALGRKASDAVPRGTWVPVNKAIQAFQAGTSDPALKAFAASNLTIINTYARAINPNGVGTVADKEHASEILSTADGPKAYKAALDQLDKEIEMAHQSPAKARAGFKTERSSRMGGTQGAAGKPAQVIQNGHTYDLQPDGSYK